jgi:hypothetical protein
MELVKGQFYVMSDDRDTHIFIYTESNGVYLMGFFVDILQGAEIHYTYGGRMKCSSKQVMPLNMNLIEFHSYLKSFNNIPNQVFILFIIWYNRLN